MATRLKTETLLAFTFGVVFIVTILVFAIAFPEPKPFPYFVFRVVLSLAAAGVSVVIPGILDLKLPIGVRAGGAIAVFAAVYFLNPAQLVINSVDVSALDEEIQFRAKKIESYVTSAKQSVDTFKVKVEENPNEFLAASQVLLSDFKSIHAHLGFYYTGIVVLPAEYMGVVEPEVENPEFQDMDFITLVNQRWRLMDPDTPINSASKTLLSQFQELVAVGNVSSDFFVFRGAGRGASTEDNISAIIDQGEEIERALTHKWRIVKGHELVRPILNTQ